MVFLLLRAEGCKVGRPSSHPNPQTSVFFRFFLCLAQGRGARRGLVAAAEDCGGQVVADTCVVVAPVNELGFRSMATPSGKGAYYGPSHARLAVYYGTLAQCIEAAVDVRETPSNEGRWTPSS